jgi:two-component system cell cycle response regulator DivK
MSRPLLMIVDDDVDGLEMWSEFLSTQGFEVCATSTALHAIELAVTRRPDVILTDVAMPLVDGWTILTTLREHPLTAKTPIVVMTGRTDPASSRDAERRGCSGFVTKPCDPQALATMLHSTLAATAPA